jgi:hypothetical protein
MNKKSDAGLRYLFRHSNSILELLQILVSKFIRHIGYIIFNELSRLF